jgi:hypothetical protein
MSYFYDRFTHDQPDTDPSIQLSGPKEGVSDACTREIYEAVATTSIKKGELNFSNSFGSSGPFHFLIYNFSPPYPTFPPMTISTTVGPKTTNIYSLQYTTSKNSGTVYAKISGNSLSFELDELTDVKSFTFVVVNNDNYFILTPLIGSSTRIPVPIKQVRKPRRRHEIIGVSKISFPLAQHQSE